jgi:hypothetical protein
MARSKKAKDVVIPDILKPIEVGHWRLIVDFPDALTKAIRAEADRLGINYQATVKTLVDEALRQRLHSDRTKRA